ncbi:hypothetical protein KO494_13845 [Lacinutrix sp. C3R15]|uniref:DUF6913 domain-containing protein n=1 Tax=Flavobacteriaceae TaxID=49546 RepID=UPI001C094136|nr:MULTISPECIES: hypothetical protein [Flavobacteriaceae]MBU2940625.1 hypothetical protein [Lacinutrix sp. C3R15]MDO6623943.1 hypothetical protein [Oceanihabitans sp. 1_MG-2023]
MILKGFKQNSTKKYISKLLASRKVFVDNKKISSLGILLNMDEYDDFESFRQFAKEINVTPNNLKIIAFTSNKKKDLHALNFCFNPKDFRWNGKVKNAELQDFLNTPFDALVSYYKEDILSLKVLTAASKAKFKIGVLQTDNRLNDLIIDTNFKQFNLFKNELIKYLNTFNKISNE